MVVTIFVFHGYRRAGREDTASCLAKNAVEFTVKRGSTDDFLMRGLPFSVTPKTFGANAGSKARKIAKEKRPSEQRFSHHFSNRFPLGDCVDRCEGLLHGSRGGMREPSLRQRLAFFALVNNESVVVSQG